MPAAPTAPAALTPAQLRLARAIGKALIKAALTELQAAPAGSAELRAK